MSFDLAIFYRGLTDIHHLHAKASTLVNHAMLADFDDRDNEQTILNLINLSKQFFEESNLVFQALRSSKKAPDVDDMAVIRDDYLRFLNMFKEQFSNMQSARDFRNFKQIFHDNIYPKFHVLETFLIKEEHNLKEYFEVEVDLTSYLQNMHLESFPVVPDSNFLKSVNEEKVNIEGLNVWILPKVKDECTRYSLRNRGRLAAKAIAQFLGKKANLMSEKTQKTLRSHFSDIFDVWVKTTKAVNEKNELRAKYPKKNEHELNKLLFAKFVRTADPYIIAAVMRINDNGNLAIVLTKDGDIINTLRELSIASADFLKYRIFSYDNRRLHPC